MNGLSDRMEIAHKPDEPFGKIAVVRHRPQGSAVTVYEYRLVLQHALRHLPAPFCAVNT
ncbi:hypothetical protein D3C85_1870080 [compost metagenome]